MTGPWNLPDVFADFESYNSRNRPTESGFKGYGQQCDAHEGAHVDLPRNLGACCSSWLDPTAEAGLIGPLFPEHVFAMVVTDCHLPDPEANERMFWEVVRQFARIEGCAWARMYEQRENRAVTRDDLAPVVHLPDGSHQRLLMPDDWRRISAEAA